MIRVELVEDHTLMRQGTRALLRAATDIEIVAKTGQGEEALALAGHLRPDVVLLDIRLLPGLNGIDVARALRQDLPDIKVLVLSAYPHETYVRTLFAIGVHGYLLKTASALELAEAIRAVQRGEQWLSPEVAAQIASRKRRAVMRSTETLTEREREVLELIGQGKGNKDIARMLSIEPSTAESHVHNALAKLDAHSRTEALKRAVQRGIIVLELDVNDDEQG